jgi:hypothetical protein
VLDSVGATAYRYTAFGAVLSEDGPWADDTVSYAYTANRLRQSMSLLQPNSTAWSQTYDSSDHRALNYLPPSSRLPKTADNLSRYNS